MLSQLHVFSEISLFQSHCFCFFVHLFLKLQTNVETCSLHATHVTQSPDICTQDVCATLFLCIAVIKIWRGLRTCCCRRAQFYNPAKFTWVKKKCCLTLKKQNKTAFRKKRCSKLVFIMCCKSGLKTTAFKNLPNQISSATLCD